VGLIGRIARRLKRELFVRLRIDPVTLRRIEPRRDLVRLGNSSASWTVPRELLGQNSLVYCAGCGEDISFDLALIEQFHCDIHAFDPTPRAIAHVAEVARGIDRYHFHPVGLWSERRTLRFFAPKDPKHVSHSILNVQGTEEFFEAEVVRLSEFQRELGHPRLDLLKLDIEGAEYKVLETLLDDGIFPRVLCVEFDEYFHPLDADYLKRIGDMLTRLVDRGYSLAHTSGNANYTLVLTSAPRTS
jgi:FkbM family methyltransferase